MKKLVGVEVEGETIRLTGEFVGETYKVLECTQTHPPGESAPEGPDFFVGSGGGD